MPGLTRKTFKLFGGSGTLSNFGQFGSKQAGLPQTSLDPTVIQQLAAWLAGWSAAISGTDKAPYMQDMNGVMYVFSYMTAYLYQMGIPEWDTGTTYYTNSVVQANNGQWFKSLQDSNLGNAPPASASNAYWEWVNPPLPTVPDVNNTLSSGLIIRPNAGSPATKVDVLAEALSVEGFVAANLSVINDSTATGANGIDTGARAVSSWYYIWAIYNPTTVTFASLVSLSSTAPTLPAGYTLKRLIGAVATDGSNNYIPFYQLGNVVTVTQQAVFTDQVGVAAFTLQTSTAIIPANAKTISGNLGTSQNVQRAVAIASDANGLGAQYGNSPIATGMDGFYGVTPFNVLLKTPQAFYWKAEDANAYYRITVSGYTF